MKFIRSTLDRLTLDTIRALAARDGWLLESADVIRAGFGGRAFTVTLERGLEHSFDVVAQLKTHELIGEQGPDGTGIVAFSSLPFDRSAPAQLDVARFTLTQFKDGRTWLTSLDGATDWRELLDEVSTPLQETQNVRSITYQPTPDEYAHNVALAVEILRRKEIDKVVLARAVLGSVLEPLDPAAVAQRLRQREPICTIYSMPIGDGWRYLGASPELLTRRQGATVQCHPLAGTIALPANAAPDDYQNWLLGSTKNLHEHSVLVDDIVTILAGSYDDIAADPSPSIVALRTVAHLGTWIKGTASEPDTAPDALALLRLLHPTAAVGGIPRTSAYELIGRLEQHDRGHYAGPIGWIDANGDGEWWVGIRGLMVRGSEFEAWAGAGIVSESDPIAEREETRDKLASVLSSVLIDRV
ncbi:MAG: isochorismate synthase [Acidimicrobiales bacterium]